MHSCLYAGTIRHRRFAPKPHDFSYGLFMVYLDLDELDTVFANRWFWSMERPNLAWFRRKDYFGDPGMPLSQAIRDFVAKKTGSPARGPVRVLTHLRYFGYCFNPVSFYYCFGPDGQRVDTIVAEITNTPWMERHSYLLDRGLDEGVGGHHRYRFDKSFHVSPFFPMDLDYDWRFSEPGERLNVHMNLARGGEKIFDATLQLQRKTMTGANLSWSLLRYPLMTVRVAWGIYFQAARLKLKGIPFFEHP